MGFKTSTLLIRPSPANESSRHFLAELGYSHYREICTSSFSHAGAGSIWIASLANCTIIYSYMADVFFDGVGTDGDDYRFFKDAILRRFPHAEMAALSLHSVVGLWGFAVMRDGAIVRRQLGFDGMIICDEGPALAVEEDYISRFERIDSEAGIHYRPHTSNPKYDDLTPADMGIELTYEIGRWFTGFELDGPELGDVSGTDYWLSGDEAKMKRGRDGDKRTKKFWPWTLPFKLWR